MWSVWPRGARVRTSGRRRVTTTVMTHDGSRMAELASVRSLPRCHTMLTARDGTQPTRRYTATTHALLSYRPRDILRGAVGPVAACSRAPVVVHTVMAAPTESTAVCASATA